METDTVYCGDCTDVMRRYVPDGAIDLLYADPPFFTEQSYEVIWGNGYERRAFDDRWKGGLQNYIAWMEPKLRECQRVLKNTGSMYLHCDWHAGHYLKKLMGKKPMKIITDGLPAYHDAYLKEYWTLKGPRTEHVRHITIRGDKNNNKMERFNGEVRDREKVMRGLKTKETPILTGYQIFHNYIRPHESLDGKTPSEACGISVQGNNKWITLIQNSERVVKRYGEKQECRKPFRSST